MMVSLKNLFTIKNLIFSGLILLTIVIRIKGITAFSVAGDEPFSIFNAQLSIHNIITELSKGNNPPLYEIFLHYWTGIFGIKPFVVRFPSVFFSVLTAWIIFRTCTQFFTLKVASIATALFALSNYQTMLAHEARVYSIFAFLTALSMYVFMDFARNPQNSRKILWLGFVNILLIYSHYFGFFVLFLQAFSVVTINDLRKSLLKNLIKTNVIVFIFYLPMIKIFLHRFWDSSIHGTWLTPVKNLGALHDSVNMLINSSPTTFLIFSFIIWLVVQKYFKNRGLKTWMSVMIFGIGLFYLFLSFSIMGPMPYYWEFSSNIAIMAGYILFIVFCLVMAIMDKDLEINTKIILLWYFLPLLIIFIASIWIPMFLDRYLIFITIGFYVLVALGIDYLEDNKGYTYTIILLALIGINCTSYIDNKRPVNQLVNKVKEIKTINDVIYVCPDYFDLNFTYYYRQSSFQNLDPINPTSTLRSELAKEHIFPVTGYHDIDTMQLSMTSKVIYIDACADFCYPNNHILNFLKSKYSTIKVEKINETFSIYEFSKNEF